MVFAFADFELDEARCQLRRRGKGVPLRRRAFDVLCHLVRNADRVVPKDELVTVVWEEPYLSDSSVAQCVTAVRRALGDDSRRPRFVDTLYGRGYRFIAPVVERRDEAPALEPVALAPEKLERTSEVKRTFDAVNEALRRGHRCLLVVGDGGNGGRNPIEMLTTSARGRGVAGLSGRRAAESAGSQRATSPASESTETALEGEHEAVSLPLAVGADPAVVLLEELDAAGADALALLAILLEDLSDAPLLVVGTCRDLGPVLARVGLDRGDGETAAMEAAGDQAAAHRPCRTSRRRPGGLRIRHLRAR